MKHLKFSIFSLIFLAIGATSCKKEVEGCTDKNSDNYNANATINLGCKYTGCTDKDAENYNSQANVSGDCVFARDKFIGKYDGTLTCPGTTLGFLSGMTTFTIDEDIAGDKNSVVVLIKTTTGLTVPIKGVCKDKTMTIDADVKNVSVTILGTATVVDVKASGEIVYDAATKTIGGPLKLDVFSALVGSSLIDTCPFTGKKQ